MNTYKCIWQPSGPVDRVLVYFGK